MCSDQKALFENINAQLFLVRKLASNLKQDLGSIAKIRRICPQILQIFTIIELTLSKIMLFDDEELEGYEMSIDWQCRFAKRTYSEIIGIDDTDTEAISSDPELKPLDQHPEEQQSFQLNSLCTARGPYRSYNTKEKLNVVRLYREGKSYAFISRLLRIPQKNIVRWCKNGIYRKEGAGRKIGDAEMEKKVIQWIQKQHIEGKPIIGKDIRNMAMEYSTKQEFKSSKGWLKNFMRRHSLLVKYESL